MKFPSEEEQRRLVKQWAETGRSLDEMRMKALRGMPYDWEKVDALLQLAENYDGPPRFGEGEVEMQRLFMLHPDHPAQKQKRADDAKSPDDCEKET